PPYPPMSGSGSPMAGTAIASGLRGATMLADYTTLGLGGPAQAFVSADTEQGLIDAVRAAHKAGQPVLLVGGGANLVISDDGFPGTVIHVNTRGLTYVDAGDGAVTVTVAAGDDLGTGFGAASPPGLGGPWLPLL